jgi:hypothetical protein
MCTASASFVARDIWLSCKTVPALFHWRPYTNASPAQNGLRPAPKGPAEGPCHADQHTDSMKLNGKMQQQKQLQGNEQRQWLRRVISNAMLMQCSRRLIYLIRASRSHSSQVSKMRVSRGTFVKI